jgi:hypothetical protein
MGFWLPVHRPTSRERPLRDSHKRPRCDERGESISYPNRILFLPKYIAFTIGGGRKLDSSDIIFHLGNGVENTIWIFFMQIGPCRITRDDYYSIMCCLRILETSSSSLKSMSDFGTSCSCTSLNYFTPECTFGFRYFVTLRRE